MVSVNRPLTELFDGVYQGASVVVTGHTGFKGSWLCEWLLSLGASITGFALPPETVPSLFSQLDLGSRVRHCLGDIQSFDDLHAVVTEANPDFVFHLAAQPLVRRSYREPVSTWETNVLGTIQLMEALRGLRKPCATVIVTTDKCYENREWMFRYREEDSLGGHDPYSSSKAAVELAVASWRRSFFNRSHPVRLASARAGNVIGGGDWSEDRIIPDAIRALTASKPVLVRNPQATRPWQHVLEPTSGYLALGAALASQPNDNRLNGAFNVGPDPDANQTVRSLVEMVLEHWPGTVNEEYDENAVHEAGLLQLENSKIFSCLGWRPVWGFQQAVEHTVNWYRDVGQDKSADIIRKRTLQDIYAYETSARDQGVDWAGQS